MASGTSRLGGPLLASARLHLPMRTLGSLHESLDLADQVVVVELTRATEQTFLGLRFVHSLNDTVQVDLLVEALAEAHDRIEEPGASPPSGDEIDENRADGQPKGDEVHRTVQQQL